MTILTMLTQGVGAIINIILDPILIFGKFGLPAMGVKGAAYATVISQILGATLGFYLNYKYNKEIKVRNIKPDFKIIKEIYRVGLPSVTLIAITSLALYFLNIILSIFSSTAVATMGAYFKIQSFIFMPVFGLNNGIIPVVAYNYGAKRKDRAIKAIELGLKIGVLISIFGLIIFQVFPHQLLSIFNASESMLEIGIPAIRIISFSFIFVGYNFVASAIFQSLGNGILSLITSIVRQVLVLLPVAYLFSLTGRLELVWLSYPIAELATFFYCKYHLNNFAYKKIEEM